MGSQSHIEAFGQVVLTAPQRKVQATRTGMATVRGIWQARTRDLIAAQGPGDCSGRRTHPL